MLIVINTRVIGLAEYEISSEEPDVITARYLTFGSAGAMGSGRAVGDTSNGFPGDYHVQYFDADGKMAGDLDLHIASVGESFQLTWRHRRENVRLPALAGEVIFEGIGFPTGERTMALTYWMSQKLSAAIELRPLL
ncbi:hypothetical protein [Mycobacterium angelicum]|uniref:Allene oxide cyclase barrel-like domain-containing protein n=1 Tax=Mycobacterium angelicum TaxID=470074 RepID=A0A1W9ZYA3_MYCAN|nr:hypothetical protein [Mycobacterium angelicum]MCV7198114.1 hypothetical protein [Mycobacterium angelicum]ORA22734.1 hypothetical protein BST12_09215 [Mycobacterium angelicum]